MNLYPKEDVLAKQVRLECGSSRPECRRGMLPPAPDASAGSPTEGLLLFQSSMAQWSDGSIVPNSLPPYSLSSASPAVQFSSVSLVFHSPQAFAQLGTRKAKDLT